MLLSPFSRQKYGGKSGISFLWVQGCYRTEDGLVLLNPTLAKNNSHALKLSCQFIHCLHGRLGFFCFKYSTCPELTFWSAGAFWQLTESLVQEKKVEPFFFMNLFTGVDYLIS